MKTPKQYTQNIKNKVITMEMLSDCLYSVNKRAKNCRDQARSYGNSWSRYAAGYESSYREKEEEYYSMKEKMLKLLHPVCIHHEIFGYERIRTYSYEKNYYKRYERARREGKVVWTNSYYDYETDMEIEFFDVEDRSKPRERYYLFYELLDHSYHTPIRKDDIESYPELQVVELDGKLITHGCDETKLVSVQFVKKLIDLIKSGNFFFHDETHSAQSALINTLKNNIKDQH